MAYLDDVFLYDYQQTDNVQRELLTDEFGLIEAFKQDTLSYKALTPKLRAFIETQMNRSFKMPALKEQPITTLTAESFNIPANISTGEMTTGTVVTQFSGFHYYKALTRESAITREEYIQNKLTEIFKSFALAKEASIYTFLDGRKTQQLPYNPAANDGITFGASALTATLAAQKELIFSNLDAILAANGVMGRKRMVASHGAKMMLNYKDMYGASNSVNLQETGMIPMLTFSNRVTNANRWTGYVWKEGSFALVNNFSADFVDGEDINGGSIKWDITGAPVPFLNEQVMTYYEKDKADASGLMTNTTNWKMTAVEKFGFIHKFVILGPYNSDIANRFNPVIKIIGAAA